MVSRRVTHCPNGHEYSDAPSETTHFSKTGARTCKICRREKDRRRRAENTAKIRQLGAKHNGPYKKSPEERFWEKVDIREEDECWPWIASVKQRGYGCFWDGDKLTQAHRFSLELKEGRKLDKHEVTRHTCDYPPCCNPKHLVAGTAKDNHADKVSRGRHHNQAKTTCPKGHPYDGVVTKKDGSKRRYCKQCKADRTRELREWRARLLSETST